MTSDLTKGIVAHDRDDENLMQKLTEGKFGKYIIQAKNVVEDLKRNEVEFSI